MNNPALKGEVSPNKKMLKQIKRELRRNSIAKEDDAISLSTEINRFPELNFEVEGNSSLCLKAEISLPCM